MSCHELMPTTRARSKRVCTTSGEPPQNLHSHNAATSTFKCERNRGVGVDGTRKTEFDQLIIMGGSSGEA